MKGVEVIPGRHTATDVLEASKAYIKSLGKEPCEARDYAGFIVSRLVDALMNEAILCVMDGNKPEEVDKARQNSASTTPWPARALRPAGADIVLHGLETMYAEFGERLRPAPFLKNMCAPATTAARRAAVSTIIPRSKRASLSSESRDGVLQQMRRAWHGIEDRADSTRVASLRGSPGSMRSVTYAYDLNPDG